MGSVEKALEFLRRWRPGGPWALVAIQLDKKNITTIQTKDEGEIRSFLAEHIGIRNIYFHVNPLLRITKSKASKEDVREAICLHVDVDPEKNKDWGRERTRILASLGGDLPSDIPPPSLIIDSGGGYQAFWLLENPVVVNGNPKACEEFELYNVRLSQILGGDHCHNIDRIMRLPGTVNIPDELKKSKGRTEREASVVFFDENLKYSIDNFQKASSQDSGISHDGGEYGIGVDLSGPKTPTENLSILDSWGVTDDIKIIIAQGNDPSNPLKEDNSRSAWLFACVSRLLSKGVPDRVIYDIITDSRWPISESVLDKGNPDKYAKRQIKRAKEHGVSPELMKMNEKYAVITNISGKCRVISEWLDTAFGRTVVSIFDFPDIRKAEDNKFVVWTEDGKELRAPRGKWWLVHPYRREFKHMRFSPGVDEPGVYNMWRGFSVTPTEGDCSLYLEHLRENICSGVDEWYQYLIHWMARCVQQPGQQGEVAVVLQGLKGSGKSLMATMFGHLFGRHFFHASDPSHVVGNFNAHLEDVVLLFADEAFFAGDRRQDQALKRIITEKTLTIEPKGFDKRQCQNYVHLVIASNDAHVVRATGDERRYFILKVNPKERTNKKYFKAIIDQMESGGYEALLHYLMSLDLRDFQVRSPPETDALKDQKMMSLDHNEEWWYRKLQSGIMLDRIPAEAPDQQSWPSEVFYHHLKADYTSYMDAQKILHRLNETSFGNFLKRVAPEMHKALKRGSIKGVRFNKFLVPPIEELRKRWNSEFGIVEWEDANYEDLDRDDNPF